MQSEKMRHRIHILLLAAALSGIAIFGFNGGERASAQERTITLYNGYEGDDEEENLYCIGDTGHFEISYGSFLQEEIAAMEYISHAGNVVQVDGQGNYRVIGSGRAEVEVRGYTAGMALVFEASYCFYVCADLSAATLSSNSMERYILGRWGSDEARVSLKNAPELTYYTFEYVSSNEQMDVSCEFDADTKSIVVYSSSPGKTVLTFTINSKIFRLNLKVTRINIKKTSLVLTQKKKTTLKLKGYSGKVKWRSTRRRVARVSSKGVVKAKKVGNTVVYAVFNGQRLGCAVSVVTSARKKVINEAKRIAKGTYSQPKRMQKGYYDCSSLVWRSYKKAGKYFGDKHYAPVAADIAKWCFAKKKRIKGGLSSSNLRNMKLHPGDLFFEGGMDNGRYKGIYHVEMFVGYQCEGFDSNNKPILASLWAARPANCYLSGMMARP